MNGITKSCFIPLFYIKPQRSINFKVWMKSCFIPLFYIKPQPRWSKPPSPSVVLYLCSTSNHNTPIYPNHITALFYTFVLHQTTTQRPEDNAQGVLFYTFVLHQTTTWRDRRHLASSLFYTFVLHQTTTCSCGSTCRSGCFIPLFYIKPQRQDIAMMLATVVLYLCSTSNHNFIVIYNK